MHKKEHRIALFLILRLAVTNRENPSAELYCETHLNDAQIPAFERVQTNARRNQNKAHLVCIVPDSICAISTSQQDKAGKAIRQTGLT